MIAIAGPTAVGKTGIALALAERFDGEIVSVDSVQVYRYMDVGTAKPSREELRRVAHHLIDILSPDQEYHVGRFIADAMAAIDGIHARGKVPILAGGTGLYLDKLMQGICDLPAIDPAIRAEISRRLKLQGGVALHAHLQLVDPASAARLHPNDRQRICRALEIFTATGVPWSEHLARQKEGSLAATSLIIGLDCPRDLLYERIDRRVATMMAAGFEEEVRGLLAMGYGPGLKAMQSIGYRHMCRHLAGDWTMEQTLAAMAMDTRRYAKRQLTWFRRVPGIAWFDAARSEPLFRRVEAYLRHGGRRSLENE
ncbi:MAG: tRNA (adenosine(37)-N6)-dimethylallyltransferase MiaA [Thermodesulfobacteriota bacterium]